MAVRPGYRLAECAVRAGRLRWAARGFRSSRGGVHSAAGGDGVARVGGAAGAHRRRWPAHGDRRRYLRDHEAPARPWQGPVRRRQARARLLQPGYADAVGRGCGRGKRARQPRTGDGWVSAMIVRPYGDTTGDGMVQLSFTLPVPADKRAEGAALQLAGKMGLDPAMVVHTREMGGGFTFFVL